LTPSSANGCGSCPPSRPRIAAPDTLRSVRSPGRVLPDPVWERASTARLFEEVIRENIDLGRPEQVQLIFDARCKERLPPTADAGRALSPRGDPLLARLLQEHALKQYHKEGRALRTETTINNTYDSGSVAAAQTAKLREIGLPLTGVSSSGEITHDCHSHRGLPAAQQPIQSRISVLPPALRDPRVQALLAVLFCSASS